MRYADGGGLTAKGRRRREAVRVEAAGLFAEGLGPVEVARRLRVSSKSAYQWHQAWTKGGVAALASRGASGRRCKLSTRCREKLAVCLEQGPAAHGWDQDQVWTGARVARDLGIHEEALRNWVRQTEADAGERDDRLTTAETHELKQLRKENAELRRANEILKAASVFFAQEIDRPRTRPSR